MRPHELTLNGFRSYADQTTFDWRGRGLVGIVGPIGSGKSTILDGIALALYGQTPRSGVQTGSLINQRRDVAQISLTFEVDGALYKAVRSLRSQSAHALYRIDDGEEIVIADRKREMDSEIEKLLGLDFAAFQRSVLLAQNQFAEFLGATKGERDQVLKGVFGFDRLDAMRTETKRRLDALGTRMAVLEDRRSTAETDRADLVRRRAELEAAEQRATALEALRVPFEQTKATITAAEQATVQATTDLGRLDELADRIPRGDGVEALLSGAGDAAGRVANASETLTAVSQERATATEALESVLAPIGGRSGLERAGDLVAAWRAARDRREGIDVDRAEQSLAELRRRATEAESASVEAGSAVVEAREVEAEAARSVENADTALLAAQQTHRAHAVRADLVVGEPCPVCEQTVATVPEDAVPASLDEAQGASADARARAADASGVVRDATEAQARAVAEAESARRAAMEAETALGELREQKDFADAALESAVVAVAAAIGEGDPPAVLDGIRNRAADATESVERSTEAEAIARAALEEARAAASEAQSRLGTLRTELAAVSGSLGLALDIGETTDAVAAALERVRNAWIERRAAAAEAVDVAEKSVTAGRAALADLLQAADLGVGDDLVEIISAAVQERSGKEAEVGLLEKRLADLEQLAADESGLVEQRQLLERLHGDLAPAKFLRHVLDERRQMLGDLASEHFETLSAGRYRFDESGEFAVVDLTWAETPRDASSLSGGETFLASLALALALAEIVSREGGRLDAFFLDEGFGSLDPEHLDLAMDGVERLVSSGPDRLVVVVSHVPALQDRIEDLIVLDRDPMTGNTKVVSGLGG